MSNANLKELLSKSIAQFEAGQVGLISLTKTIENAGSAIEAIPYNMASELRSIVTRLEIEQGYEDEGFVSDSGPALAKLKDWLLRVPN
jgi:hypothetical protein